MTTWADVLQSRANLDQVVKRTRNSLHLRLDSEHTLALCTGAPLHAWSRAGLWVPVESLRPSRLEVLSERLHRPLVDLLAAPMMAMANYPGGTGDKEIYSGLGSNYTTSRNTSSDEGSTANNARSGQRIAAGPNYQHFRAYFLFDTSGITTANIVTQANLKLVVVTDASAADVDMDIVKQAWGGGREADWDGALTAALDDSIWRNTAGMSLNTVYTSGNLSNTWVVRDGTTYYSIVGSTDRSGTQPSVNEYVYFATANHATAGYRPVLAVLYTPAATGRSYVTMIG